MASNRLKFLCVAVLTITVSTLAILVYYYNGKEAATMVTPSAGHASNRITFINNTVNPLVKDKDLTKRIANVVLSPAFIVSVIISMALIAITVAYVVINRKEQYVVPEVEAPPSQHTWYFAMTVLSLLFFFLIVMTLYACCRGPKQVETVHNVVKPEITFVFYSGLNQKTQTVKKVPNVTLSGCLNTLIMPQIEDAKVHQLLCLFTEKGDYLSPDSGLSTVASGNIYVLPVSLSVDGNPVEKSPNDFIQTMIRNYNLYLRRVDSGKQSSDEEDNGEGAFLKESNHHITDYLVHWPANMKCTEINLLKPPINLFKLLGVSPSGQSLTGLKEVSISLNTRKGGDDAGDSDKKKRKKTKAKARAKISEEAEDE